MKKLILTILVLMLFCCKIVAQQEVTTSEMASLYKSTSFRQISVHDPSVFYDSKSQYFYIYGSHYFGGKSKDLRNWEPITNYYKGGYDSRNAYKAFKSNPTRKVKRVLPGKTEVEEVDFPSFDASAFCSIYTTSTEANWVSGDQWAPDVVWNPTMNKWCYYLSLNGDNWASVVVLMTADEITGPYTYQGPVVFGGFTGKTYTVTKDDGTEVNKKVNYKDTDLEIVLGTQSSLPGRYNTTDSNGEYWPNCIDPCAFFDEEGELWLIYGSWSGGIFMLKLDKETGLRDYTYTYKGTGSTPDRTVLSDAYYGTKIAGGCYVSGEGPYIQHIGKYYYLFMSYGFFSPDGGYEMRVFRSDKPTGPYKDAAGQVATYTSYQMNYGPNAATNKGMKLIGAMNGWGNMTVGECAQGHNSACVDDKGRSFLVCHTKFNNGTAGHSVRSYQLYQNKQGWLCTAPFQFNGETTTDETIATTQPWSADDVEGDYSVIIHPYKLDYAKFAEAKPINLHLSKDGKITGDKSGTWKYIDEGASYIQLVIGGVTYSGVFVEQTLENNTAKTLCFTAVCSVTGSSVGVPVWGYKLHPRSAIAYNYQQNTAKLKAFGAVGETKISKNAYIMFDPTDNVRLTWTSSNPDVLSSEGKYNPTDEDVKMTMTARMESAGYYWQHEYNVLALAKTPVTGDPYSGIVAYYNFDGSPLLNTWNEEQKGILSGLNGTSAPKYQQDYDRFGKVLHQYFGAQKSNSYVRMPNPLKGSTDMNGFTVSLWVNRIDNNAWDALWAFFSPLTSSADGSRLFFTGNCYLGFNDNQGSWFDVNKPDNKTVNSITPETWKLVTVTFSKENGYSMYVDGTKLYISAGAFAGSADKIANFDKQKVIDHVSAADNLYLGLGSFWGSADVLYDDLLVYNRELSADDVKGLATALNRINDFTPEGVKEATGIESIEQEIKPSYLEGIYDLTGRKVSNPAHGIYIINGKKTLVR